jgi:hypothetical protein
MREKHCRSVFGVEFCVCVCIPNSYYLYPLLEQEEETEQQEPEEIQQEDQDETDEQEKAEPESAARFAFIICFLIEVIHPSIHSFHMHHIYRYISVNYQEEKKKTKKKTQKKTNNFVQ